MCIPVTRTLLYMCVSLPLIERKKWAWNFVDTQTPRADLKNVFWFFEKVILTASCIEKLPRNGDFHISPRWITLFKELLCDE